MTMIAFDDEADAAYAECPDEVAEWADRVFDWLEEDPPNVHARQHRFSSGQYAVLYRQGEDEWAILWEQLTDERRVRYLGPNFL